MHCYIIKHLEQISYNNNYRPETFEYGCWKLTVKGMCIHLHEIYRPPDGNLNLFLEIFTKYATRIANQSNVIFTRDCNVAINDDQDQQAEIFTDTISENFTDTISALGLNQHLTFSTHRLNNILDVVINELISNIKVCDG